MILGVTALINKEKDLELSGSSSDSANVVEQVKEANPDALVLDISLYTQPSLDLIRDVAKSFPEKPITVLSIHKEFHYAEKALKAGARAYVLKLEDPRKLLAAIRATLAGKTYVSEGVVKQPGIEKPPAESPINTLSQRQFTILQQIGKGFTNRQISEGLKLPPKTVDDEVGAIGRKLGLSDSTELLQFAIHWVHHEGGFA